MTTKNKSKGKMATKSKTGAGREAIIASKPIRLPKGATALATLKFSRLGGDDKLATRLAKAGFHSLHQIALLDAKTIKGKLTQLTPAEEKTLASLQRNARRLLTHAADNAVVQMQARSPGGNWHPGPYSVSITLPPGITPAVTLDPEDCHCGCCDSIFSLKAYLFDLLDMLVQYWHIDLKTVEKLLLRSFELITAYSKKGGIKKGGMFKLGLTCEALNVPLPQARIACEVMEQYLKQLGKTAPAAWKKTFVDELLRLILPQQVAAAMIASQPDLGKRTADFTIAKVEAAPNLPEGFVTAISMWKTKLITLVPDLAGIDKANALLADNSQGMIGQEPDEKFAERREATVRQWLAGYRDALCSASGKERDTKERDTLEASLFISLDSGACRTTTRLQELVISVQQIVESIRSGEIQRLNRPGLPSSLVTLLHGAVTQPLAERAWERLRDYETWLGYMYGWVYPENVLNPRMAAVVVDSHFIDAVNQLQDELITDEAIRTAYLDGSLQAPSSPHHQEHMDESKNDLLQQITTMELRTWKHSADLAWGDYAEYIRGVHGRSYILNHFKYKDFERHIWFPLVAALILNRNQRYASAHQWYQLLYDPETQSAPIVYDHETKSSVSVFDKYSGDVSEELLGVSWLDEPYDPAAIAFRRKGVWLRHTIVAMVRNLIDWADDEFARGRPDTIQRAQELYELASRTLRAPPMQEDCEKVQEDLLHVIQNRFGISRAAVQTMVQPLKEVRSVDLMRKAGKDIRKALKGGGAEQKKRKAVESIIAETVKKDYRMRPDSTLAAENARLYTLACENENLIFSKTASDAGTGTTAALFLSQPRFAGPGPGPGGIAPPGGPLDDSKLPGGRPFDDSTLKGSPGYKPPKDAVPPPSARPFCMPPNPLLHSLQLHINTQLDKLRKCLDFLGEPQLPRVYGCDTYDSATVAINRPTATLDQYNYCVDQPRYRYNFLIEKARQYVDVAQRFGSLLLQALQHSDNESFNQLKAQHAIELAGATTELRRLGRKEALDGTVIAGLQKERAASQVTFWSNRIGDPDDLFDDLSADEAQSLQRMNDALASQQESVKYTRVAMAAAGVNAAIGTGIAATPTPVAPVGLVMIASSVAAMATVAPSLYAAESQASSLEANLSSAQASFERRGEDWKNQFDLAGFDSQIADIQVNLANDRLAIARQELEISLLQLSHAHEELRFLRTKITNDVLYDWMVRVLLRDYRVLMQIAVCVARMAQRALEFERQETVQIITGDYWNIAQGALISPKLTDKQRSLGLLGAERLLTDLTKLDAYKLATEKRRLQLSKTFSLSRMMPIEMVEFRESGVITFNTLMNWFDEGFQGHYLRLIKSVRISILALVPPLDGIHGMLHNTGESSVVVLDNGIFTEKRAARNFGESIALDSAFNESGLFVLNYEDPMLLPFEGLGVQTQWTLELPRENNRFNFDTIADVFLTIEYTAEYSREYELNMRAARRGEDVYEDTAISLRMMFPDLWYHLKNQRPDAGGGFASFPFKFTASRNLFPLNLDNLKLEHLTLLVSGDFTILDDTLPEDQQTIEEAPTLETGFIIKKKNTILHSPTAKTFGPGRGDSNSLLLSTRGASAPGTLPHPDITGPEDWTLEFDPAFYVTSAANPKPLIERITDVLLVITVKGTRKGYGLL